VGGLIGWVAKVVRAASWNTFSIDIVLKGVSVYTFPICSVVLA
jgi:hypothetical protein